MLRSFPVQIIEWSVLRWQIEVTFQEVRAHMGVETQRQWSDRAIARTTPMLLGLFSWITLAAHLLGNRQLATPRSAAWYVKSEPTFVDAIALVRRQLWIASATFCTSSQKPDMQQLPTPLVQQVHRIADLRGMNVQSRAMHTFDSPSSRFLHTFASSRRNVPRRLAACHRSACSRNRWPELGKTCP